MGYFDDYDEKQWLNTLIQSPHNSMKRFAASHLIQTQSGLQHIQKLYKEQPGLIKDTYTYVSDDCLHKLMNKGSGFKSTYNPSNFIPLAHNCPICGTVAEDLAWVFGDLWNDCGHWQGDPTWLVVCKKCNLQLQAFSEYDTPPPGRISKDTIMDNQTKNSKLLHEETRHSWNAATKQHHSHKPDLIERYKNGWNNLYPEETALLGDVKGKSVVHLQCNDGQDTLSIANHLGGVVTGVDISDEAIDFARKMSDEANIPGEFIRADVFDWFDENETLYDVVYTGYGAINWISDIKRWAKGIAKTLKPGGRFVVIDFHPMGLMLELDWTLKYDYMGGQHYSLGGVGDYVGDDYEGNFKNPHASHEFAWGIGDVVSALLKAGLTLNHLQEYPFVNGWQQFPEMREADGRRWYPPDDKPTLALMFSIVATKSE